MTKKEMLLIRIEKLQQTRDYADEVESRRLIAEIQRLLALLEKEE
jgi:hypothetical protein